MTEKVERKTIVRKKKWKGLKKEAIDDENSNGVQEFSGNILEKYEDNELIPVEHLPENAEYDPENEELKIL